MERLLKWRYRNAFLENKDIALQNAKSFNYVIKYKTNYIGQNELSGLHMQKVRYKFSLPGSRTFRSQTYSFFPSGKNLLVS